MVSGNEAEIVFNATIDAGWHLYSTDIPDGGPTPATITFETTEGVELNGGLTPVGEITREYDSMFEMELSYFVDKGSFAQRFTITDTTQYRIAGYMEYAACNDMNCLPPTQVPLSLRRRPLHKKRRPQLLPAKHQPRLPAIPR